MSTCNLDHSLDDVIKKLESQKSYLPEDLYSNTLQIQNKRLNQSDLNELFHILKKYDLADENEKQLRNNKLQELLSKV